MHLDTAEPRPRRGRGYAAGLAAAGLVSGLVLAGLTTANAQTPSPATPPPSAAPEGDERARPGKRGGGHGHGHGGLGRPSRHVLHGEYTARAPEGGYQVLATQHGEATAVSPTSITLRSEDGYSRTYVVNDDTLVNAGDAGIGDVAAGHEVHVVAVVEDGTARAVRVVDVTAVGELRGRWHPRGGKGARPGGPGAPTDPGTPGETPS
jgi:hypothetical protein